MHRHPAFEIAMILCICAPLACGDDADPQTTEAATTTTGTPPETTTSGPDPDSTSTAAASSDSTTMDPTAGETTTAAETTMGDTTMGETTQGETTEGETTGGDDGVLGNTPEPCEMEDWIFPLLPAEAGHWAATTLTPSNYPYEVQSVAYELTGGAAGGQCDNSFAHEVTVFVTDVPQPVDAPSLGAQDYALYPIAEDPAATDDRLVEIDLDPPIVLEDGQSIVVAVEMTAVEDVSLCIRACRDGNIPAVDWWSNAADEPFAWADMVVDFGFASNFTIRAYGVAR